MDPNDSNLNQDALENTFGAIHLHCGSNNNQSIEQFVGALRTVIINGLAYRNMYGTARMMVPLFWTSYTHFSSHPMLHKPVHRQVMTVRPVESIPLGSGSDVTVT
jgi:hypothetical protein